jgi:hypothetical protein
MLEKCYQAIRYQKFKKYQDLTPKNKHLGKFHTLRKHSID